MGDNSNHSIMGLYFTDTRRLILKSEKVKVVYIQSNTKFLKTHPQNTKYTVIMNIGRIRNDLL